MVAKTQILEILTRKRLIELATRFDARGLTGYAKDNLIVTLYKFAQDGKLPGQKVGRHWRFHKMIDEWLDSREVKGAKR